MHNQICIFRAQFCNNLHSYTAFTKINTSLRYRLECKNSL